METIHMDKIPEFMKNNDLYNTLFENDVKTIIPKKYLPVSPKIKTYDQFCKFIEMCRFWCIDHLPYSVYEYIID